MRRKVFQSPFSRRAVLRGAGAASAGLALTGLSAGLARPARADETLSVMIIQPHAVAGDMMAAAYEAQTGVRVEVTAVPYDQVQAQATLDVQSGANRFDVLDYWYTSKGALAEDGILTDVTDWIERDRAMVQPDDFIPSIYDTYTLHNGRRWGLPYDGDTHVLFYNREIFDRHGLGAPATWDDYLTAARTITEAERDNGIYGAAMLGFRVPIIICSSFVNRLAGFAGTFFDADGRPALDSEPALMAAEAMLAVAPHCLPTPLETAFDQALPAFLSGRVAMMEFWTDLGVYAQDPEGSQIVDKWGVVQMPIGGGATQSLAALNAGFCFGVSSGSRNPERAWDFIRWATGQEFGLELLTTTGTGMDPTRLSTLQSPAYRDFAPLVQEAATASLSGVLAWPTIPESPRLMEALADALAAMLAGERSPQAAMAQAQQAWERILR